MPRRNCACQGTLLLSKEGGKEVVCLQHNRRRPASAESEAILGVNR